MSEPGYRGGVTRVLLAMLDGVRPDAIERADTPTLDRLVAAGSHTLRARSVVPSITLPCHLSLFHSVPPERHNTLDNHYAPMARPVPGLVETLAAAGRRCGLFFSWEPLRDLSRPLALDRSVFVGYRGDPDRSDERLLEAALPHLASAELDFAFLYFGAVDEIGHLHGWMSDPYLERLHRTDLLLGRALAVVPDDTVVIVQSDHGGHGRSHGSDADEDVTIPWIVSGPGVRRGATVERRVSILDTAPTVARLLGVEAPVSWEGEVVTEVFA